MELNNSRLAPLITEVNKLADMHMKSTNVDEAYFEPIQMEFLDKYYGEINQQDGTIIMRFDVKGTRYEGRMERIEFLSDGENVHIIREPDHQYNPNNFTFLNQRGENIGNMPAELCNALAPLYDSEEITIDESRVSYVEPLSKRNKYARWPMLFVEIVVAISA